MHTVVPYQSFSQTDISTHSYLAEFIVAQDCEQGHALEDPQAHLLLEQGLQRAEHRQEVVLAQLQRFHGTVHRNAVGVPRLVEHQRHFAEVVPCVFESERE